MSDHAEGPGGAPHDPPSDGERNDNTLSDVRNLLGFLLAGFGAILSFIGLRSSEVTTVLRNDSAQASLIAVILLLGVLAAVLATAVNVQLTVSPLRVAAIVTLLLGVGSFVIFLIPAATSYLTPATISFALPGSISLAVSCFLIGFGICMFIFDAWIHRRVTQLEGQLGKTCGTSPEAAKPPEDIKRLRARLERSERLAKLRLMEPGAHVTVVLLLASVILIGIAAYGAMRLEANSQLSGTVQVTAAVSLVASNANLSVQVNAAKLSNKAWAAVEVYGVSSAEVAERCTLVHRKSPPCREDPCGYRKYVECAVLMNGTILPNATGDVNQTIKVPFDPVTYQYIDVRASPCTAYACHGVGHNASRLDMKVPAPSKK
jgi:hypothetical protein